MFKQGAINSRRVLKEAVNYTNPGR